MALPKIKKQVIDNIFLKSGLYQRYPAIKLMSDECNLFIRRQMSSFHAKKYHMLKRHFIRNLCTRIAKDPDNKMLIQQTNAPMSMMSMMSISKMKFSNYIDEVCITNLYRFRVYYLHKPDEFRATNYLTNFFGCDIVTIIDLFKEFVYNKIDNCHDTIIKNFQIKPILIDILNNHLIMTLAQIFYVIEKFMNNLKYVNKLNIFLSNPKHRSCLIINEENIQSYLDKYYLKWIITDDVRIVQKCIITSFTTQKKILSFLVNTNISELKNLCQQIPDLDAHIGYFIKGKQKFDTKIVINNIIRSDIMFLEYIIDFNDTYFDTNQIIDLKLPVRNSYKNMVIEI